MALASFFVSLPFLRPESTTPCDTPSSPVPARKAPPNARPHAFRRGLWAPRRVVRCRAPYYDSARDASSSAPFPGLHAPRRPPPRTGHGVRLSPAYSTGPRWGLGLEAALPTRALTRRWTSGDNEGQVVQALRRGAHPRTPCGRAHPQLEVNFVKIGEGDEYDRWARTVSDGRN
jgi:hypothetical protein